MSSFKNFWSKFKDLPIESTNEVLPSSSLTASLQDNIVTATIFLVSTELAFSGFNNNQEEAEKFSEQVAEYMISDELISAVSDQVGEPKLNETEDDFVERAATVLKNILNNKFQI